jgi:hypothetical protein
MRRFPDGSQDAAVMRAGCGETNEDRSRSRCCGYERRRNQEPFFSH